MKYVTQILKESKTLLFSQFFVALILIFQVSIVSKGLGLEKYGEVAILTTFISLIFRILHSRNNDVTLIALNSSKSKIYLESICFDILLGFFGTTLLLFVFNSELLTYFDISSNLEYLNLFIVTRALILTMETSKAHFTYFKKFSYLSFLDFFNVGIKFLLIYIIFQKEASLGNYFLANSIANILIFIITFFLSMKYLNFMNFNFRSLKKYFLLIKTQYKNQRIDQIAGIFAQHFDILILGYFSDVSSVGIYRIAKRLSEPVNYLINGLVPIIQNKLSISNKNTFNFSKFIKKFLFPLSIFGFLFYYFFGKKLLLFISGPEYVTADKVLLILVIGQFIYLNTFWIRISLLFNNLIKKHAISRGINTITFAFSSILLVPYYEAYGIAASMSLAVLIQKIYEYLIYRKNIYKY